MLFRNDPAGDASTGPWSPGGSPALIRRVAEALTTTYHKRALARWFAARDDSDASLRQFLPGPEYMITEAQAAFLVEEFKAYINSKRDEAQQRLTAWVISVVCSPGFDAVLLMPHHERINWWRDLVAPSSQLSRTASGTNVGLQCLLLIFAPLTEAIDLDWIFAEQSSHLSIDEQTRKTKLQNLLLNQFGFLAEMTWLTCVDFNSQTEIFGARKHEMIAHWQNALQQPNVSRFDVGLEDWPMDLGVFACEVVAGGFTALTRQTTNLVLTFAWA